MYFWYPIFAGFSNRIVDVGGPHQVDCCGLHSGISSSATCEAISKAASTIQYIDNLVQTVHPARPSKNSCLGYFPGGGVPNWAKSDGDTTCLSMLLCLELLAILLADDCLHTLRAFIWNLGDALLCNMNLIGQFWMQQWFLGNEPHCARAQARHLWSSRGHHSWLIIP